MALSPGTRLGAYEITAIVGAGGMGEVYRARDARLGRDVAIKVLPPSVAGDPDRLARFEREAQAVASLSHPNIVAVFEFGQHASGSGQVQPFVAMELLEGETLRERLGPGPLPVRKAIDIATQIARGLAAAHDRNLLHRDLKPENVFLLGDGQVKILDFGLARAIDDTAGGSGATQTLARTDPGAVMGTVGYMAPEQVRGGSVDARTDLFAVGAVLYEMLTGARAFQRETAAETLTAILREDPQEISRTRHDLPPALERIVQHALEKNPAERFQTARDVVFALTSLSGTSSGVHGVSSSAASTGPLAQPASVSGRVVGIAALAVVAAGALGWWLGHRQGPASVPRFDVFTQLTDEAGDESMPRISPDGASFAYAKANTFGSYDIYVQRVGGRQPIPVAADPNRDERWPAFSPDGKSIAFSLGGGGIFITGATGESERRLTDAGFNPAWSPDGKQIAFASEGVDDPYLRNSVSTVSIVDVAGGAPRVITKEDAVQPTWSPNGKRIAAWQAVLGQRDLITMAPDGSDRVVLLNDPPLDYAPAWSPDGLYLYFASDRSGTMGLWRLPMNESTGRQTGEPEAVSVNVEATMDQPSLSSDGTTVLFRSRLRSVNPTALPFDPIAERAGSPRPLTSRTGILNPNSVSPDGQWLALTNQGDIREDVFVMRTDGTGLRHLTDDGARDRQARWTPDGKALLFYSNRDGQYAPFMIRPDGSGLTRLTQVSTEARYYPAMSPVDGRLTISTDDFKTYLITPPFPAKDSQLQLLKNLEVGGGIFEAANWSPDGKYLSGGIVDKGSGASIGVGVYDLAANKAIKLTDDANQFTVPFLPDGRRLLLINPRNELVVVDIATGRRRVIPVSFGVGTTVNMESVALAPDGKTLYYGAQRVEANVWKVTRR